MHILVEEFLNDNVAFKKDCYETLINDRDKFIDWRPNWGLIRFLLEQLFPFTSSSFKSIAATAHEIADHYDRGNDFFNAFLGPMMIYTSAFCAPRRRTECRALPLLSCCDDVLRCSRARSVVLTLRRQVARRDARAGADEQAQHALREAVRSLRR